jgi:glycosyltransferase involved in cell wall biosynthesis
VYLYDLSKYQYKFGNRIDIITWAKTNYKINTLYEEYFKIYRLRGVNFSPYKEVFEGYPYLPTLPKLIKELKPDIIHAESQLFLPSYQAISTASKLNIPSVLTIHGVFADRGFLTNNAQLAYLKTFGAKMFKLVNKIICLSKGDHDEIIQLGCPKEKISIIPTAVDFDLFKPGKQNSEDWIVWSGRFVQEKGIKTLIDIAKIVLTKRSINIKFIFIGDGPLLLECMNIVRKDDTINKSVIFTGWIEREKLAEILSKSSIFIFPSLKEGMPISVLEAMSSGLPILGSDISGIKELIIDSYNGYLLKSGNSILFADKILYLLDNNNIKEKMGDNSRKQILNKYNFNFVCKQIQNIYEEVYN